MSGARIIIYVCAEPDGQQCQAGSNTRALSHQCEAIKRFHEEGGMGPKLEEVEYMPVKEFEEYHTLIRDRVKQHKDDTTKFKPNSANRMLWSAFDV